MSGIIPKSIFTIQSEGTLGVATNVLRIVMPCDGKMTNATAGLKTAPTGASLIAVMQAATTTIGTFTIPAAQFSATATGTIATDGFVFRAGNVIDIDITQVGSSVAGAGILVAISYVGVAD
jgi:hypothetical protein